MAEAKQKELKAGKVIQVMGPVVDVEFPPGNLPEIFYALRLTNPNIDPRPDNLVIEVAQHLGENSVRCFAMLLMSSRMTTVLPTPAPPNNPIFPPFGYGTMRSTTLMPVSKASTDVA